MDIRKYFPVISQKQKAEDSRGNSSPVKVNANKKKKRILDSDDEDPVPPKKKIQTVNLSDSDDDIFEKKKKGRGESKSMPEKTVAGTSSKKTVSKPNIKEKTPSKEVKHISAASFFSSASVQRTFSSFDKNNEKSSKRKQEASIDEESPFPSKIVKLDCENSQEKLSKKLSKLKKSDNSTTTKQSSAEEQVRRSPRKKEVTENKLSLKGNHNSTVSSGSADDKNSFQEKIKPNDEAFSPPKPNENSPPNKKQFKASVESYKIPKLKNSSSSSNDRSSHNEPKHTSKNEYSKSPAKKAKKDSSSISKNPQKEGLSKSRKSYTMEVEVLSPTKKSNKSNKPEAASADPSLNSSATASADGSFAEEKKKQNVLAYKKFLQRSGPRNPGSKVVPEGAAGCLAGLSFVLSGVLESLDRTEVTEIIQRYGGRVVGSVSKKTTHLLVGDEAGPSKMAKAEQLGTAVISEDDLLDMLRTRPGSSSSAADASSKVSPTKSVVAKAMKKQESPLLKALPIKPIKKEQTVLESSQSSSQTSTSSSVLTQSLGTQELEERDPSQLMWVDKYKPASLKNVIGQQGDKSNARKLLHWLKNWVQNQAGNKKIARPSPWAKDNDGAFFKAALLSGPPGVGKTTTAQLVCRELGFDFVELNASDTRSKRSLTEEVAQLLNNTSLSNFAAGKAGSATSRHHVLLMDEVDGMAGNEDRGGVQELITLLKTSKVPIICMCNDRQHPKIRSLANHCFDLRFYKPRVEQIRGAMMSVCFREGLKLKPEALDQIILGSNQDVRQVLHHLSVFSAKHKAMDTEQTKKDAKLAKKDLKFGPWDVCRQVFNDNDRKNMNIHEKSDLFFHDYSIGPLFVQENYWKARPKSAQNGGRVALLQQLAKAAQSIADGDLVERAIRSGNNWSLLPTQAVFSCVLPGEAMSGHLAGEIEFPSWLGNNSKKNKMDRLSSELLTHMRLKISGNKTDVALEYSREVLGSVVRPLLTGADGVSDAVDAMASYGLGREDLDSLGEVAHWTGKPEFFSKVDSKVKAAFTRALNKSSVTCHARPVSRKKRPATEETYGEDGEEALESGDEQDEDDDDLASDALIKVKKPTAAPGSKKSSAASMSAGRARGKGKK